MSVETPRVDMEPKTMEDHLKYYQSVRDELVERQGWLEILWLARIEILKSAVRYWSGQAKYVIHSAGNDTPERVVPPRQGKENVVRRGRR